MKNTIALLIFLLTIGFGALLHSQAGGPMDKMSEKTLNTDSKSSAFQTIDGKLLKIDGEFYVLEDPKGKQRRVHVNKETCIGCGYCLYACPFGAPQFPKGSPYGMRGVMDKCTYCTAGPGETFSDKERKLYGSNRIAEGKLPMCASVCATKALVAGDAEEVANVVRTRAAARGSGRGAWGWGAAYPTGR